MTRSSHFPAIDYTHGAKMVGKDIGRPAVKVTLDEEEAAEGTKVSSVVSQFESYNWLNSLSSGRSYLVIEGEEALMDEYQAALDSLLSIINPRYTELHVKGNHRPSRLVQNEVDSYVVFIDDFDNPPEEMDFFAKQSSNYDASDFVFDYEYQKKTRNKVHDFIREHSIYFHSTFVRVNPEDVDDYQSAYEQAETMCRQNGWYLCPPMFADGEGEEESSDE